MKFKKCLCTALHYMDWSKFEVQRSKVKVTGNENIQKIVFAHIFAKNQDWIADVAKDVFRQKESNCCRARLCEGTTNADHLVKDAIRCLGDLASKM